MYEKKHVLFLNSAAGIWAHTSTDALLLNRLARRGVKVSTVSCDGYLGGLCPVRLSRKRTLREIARKPNLDCSDCKFTANLTSVSGQVSTLGRYQIGRFLTPSGRAAAKSYFESWQSLGFPLDFDFQGIPVPRLAGYEVSLKYKSWEVATQGTGAEEYHRAALDVALTVCAASEFFSQKTDFSDLIIRSPHYANNAAFARIAQNKGIRVVFLDGSPNLTEDHTHLMIWDWGEYLSSNPAISYFNKNQPMPDGPSKARLNAHLEALRRGISHKAYSSAKLGDFSPLRAIGADPNRPTTLLALSSMDEMISAQNSGGFPNFRYPGIVFQDQYEWVRETINWFAQQKQLQLVIRVHPREFPNRRESLTSPAGIRWERELSNLPDNVFLNHPSQNISLYDLLDEVDTVVTGWSSVGLEAALFGVNLITYDALLPGYPAGIGLTGNSKEAYFANLESATKDFVEFPHRTEAIKWIHLLMNLGTTRVGGRFWAEKRNLLPRWTNLLLEGIDRYFYVFYRPLDLLRGILLEPTDGKFQRVILENKKNLYE